jgi:DeoR family transcriptional regulator, ulaG and ulaABCDEF operon transcriptional repressor
MRREARSLLVREVFMHEKERQRVILSAVQERPVVTVQDMVDLTGASEATIRRDISGLHDQKRLRRVRGGAEAISPPQVTGLLGRPFSVNEALHVAKKRAIAREAVALCQDGEPIIINGGTTTFQMVHPLANRRMTIFTNSFPIAEHLLKHSKNTVMLSGGTIYREQNIVLSPFDNDVTRNFYARRMFMGAQGLGPLGLMESDPLLIQAEGKLIDQADELVVLVDSSKFAQRSSLILCGLSRIACVITDEDIEDEHQRMLEDAGVALRIAKSAAPAKTAQGTAEESSLPA